MFCVPSVAIAALGLVSVLSFGVVAQDSAGDFSTATHLGREIEDLKASGLVDETASVRTPLNAAPFDQPLLTPLPDDHRFTRNIQTTTMIPERLAHIQVRIFYRGNKGTLLCRTTTATLRCSARASTPTYHRVPP